MGGGSCMVLRLRWMQKLAMPHRITKKKLWQTFGRKKKKKNYDRKVVFLGGKYGTTTIWATNKLWQQTKLTIFCG